MEQRLASLEHQVALMRRLLDVDPQEVAAAIPTVGAEELGRKLVDSLAAMAPLQILLDDDSINDILINGPDQIFIERDGKLSRTSLHFSSDSDVFAIAQLIAQQVGRNVDTRRPLLDARLRDGSRVNIIAPPLAVDGTAISIRKFAKRSITLNDMRERGNMSPQMAEFLKIVARCKMNIIISGGTGSGKTTLLNAISQFIDLDERIVTIEDAAELRLQQPHVVRLESRPFRMGASKEEEVSIRDLMKNALRMRPDRIIVGEVRGAEAFDMMQAMNTGHEGSFTTIHANHPRDALARLESMINMANLNLPANAIRTQIGSAIHIIIQVSRMRDGQRRIAYISEVVGMESDIITMQDLFTYHSKGETPDGKLTGDFKWSGIMPRFLRRIAYYGEADRLSQALGVKLPKI
ncbi:MAG: CpaF family protein [Rickettsiales bacterium]